MIKAYTNIGAPSQTPKTVIIHAMGEYIAGDGWDNHAVQYLKRIGLSAHSLIAPDGINYRCRKDEQGAYHAKGHNTDSLGMEILVKGNHDYTSFLSAIQTDYITEKQYNESVSQAKEWLEIWDIENFVRHSDISPERKVDPGDGFPWSDFLNSVNFK